jgi:hypothetical protein
VKLFLSFGKKYLQKSNLGHYSIDSTSTTATTEYRGGQIRLAGWFISLFLFY